MQQANHQGAEQYIENNVYRLPRVPLALLAEFFSDLAGRLLAGYK